MYLKHETHKFYTKNYSTYLNSNQIKLYVFVVIFHFPNTIP